MRIGPFDDTAAQGLEATLRQRDVAFVRDDGPDGAWLEVDPRALRAQPDLAVALAGPVATSALADEFRCTDCDASVAAPGPCPACAEDAVVDFRTWARQNLRPLVGAPPPRFWAYLATLAVAGLLVVAVVALGRPRAGTGRRPTNVAELFRGTRLLERLDHVEVHRLRPGPDGGWTMGERRDLPGATARELRSFLLSSGSLSFPRCPPNVRCEATDAPLDPDLVLRLVADDEAAVHPLVLVARDRTRIGVLLGSEALEGALEPGPAPAVVGVANAPRLAALIGR